MDASLDSRALRLPTPRINHPPPQSRLQESARTEDEEVGGYLHDTYAVRHWFGRGQAGACGNWSTWEPIQGHHSAGQKQEEEERAQQRALLT